MSAEVGIDTSLRQSRPALGEPVIHCSGLEKRYGTLEAVRGVDLTVARGEVFALLGPNGAGKTTIVEILEGHRERSAGSIDVLGFDPARGERAFKEQIGIVLQESSIDRYSTVREAVDLFRSYYPAPLPTDEVIALVGLGDKQNERVSRLSGGQQRRLDMALGLAGDPHLLFLDEPTTGFDPGARRTAWEVIRNMTNLGKTIFLTTHYMEEAQRLADRVAIIVDGAIVAAGPPGSLGGADMGKTIIDFRLPAGAPPLPDRLLAQSDGGSDRSEAIRIATDDPTGVLHALTGWALDAHVELIDLAAAKPTLEDVYLELTKSARSNEDLSATPTGSRRRRRRRR